MAIRSFGGSRDHYRNGGGGYRDRGDRGGGSFGRRGSVGGQSEDYFGYRRVQRQQIEVEGVAELWSTSPINLQTDSDTLNTDDERLPKLPTQGDLNDARKEKKKKKKAKRRKHKKEKKKRKKSRKKASKKKDDSDSSSESDSDSDDESEEELRWIEKSQDSDGNMIEEVMGPVPKQQVTLSKKDYGKALLPGEGAAMAAYVAEGSASLGAERSV
ncbi:NKAP family protein [Chionoecetes opilio]|uniref:NKAP family protein n=1 Tax=Chionoecetes opilio TaxID=41210 RepID=A0A8J4XLR1_CHIOP|nr:NKAP family protein [Chionoecetes opilio]